MGKGEIYTQKVDLNDPLFIYKDILNNQNNYLHSVARQDKDRLIAIFYFAISLLITLASTFFTNQLRWAAFLILANLLTAFLIISTRSWKKGRKRFWINRAQMKKNFKEFNMVWKD